MREIFSSSAISETSTRPSRWIVARTCCRLSSISMGLAAPCTFVLIFFIRLTSSYCGTGRSLFPHKLGRIDGECSPGRHGGSDDTKQNHGEHDSTYHRRVSGIRLIHDLSQKTARGNARKQTQHGSNSK